MKRVLLTGATGFIGSACVAPLLARGFEVHAVSSRAHSGPNGDAGWHHADLLQPDQVARLVAAVRPTHLLHLAWYQVAGNVATAPENFFWVQASLELMRQFAEQGGERVLMAGSSYEYDWRHGYCSEAVTALAPATYYGSCKQALGSLLAAHAAQSGLSHAWARIFFLYGPREHPQRLVSSVVRALLRDQPAQCSHGGQIRDYLYVDDVATALVGLLDSAVSGPVNVASGRPIALREIVGRIAAKLGREHLVRFGAVPAHSHDTPLVVGHVARLMDEVGWRPAYDFDRGLDETIAWWDAELKRGDGRDP